MTGIIQEMRDVVEGIIGDDDKASDIVYALIKQFGGNRLYIPHNDYQLRNREIKQLASQGVDIDILSKRYQLSAKTVKRIIKQP